ncbi:MAG: hypothetical protein CMK36_05100 [Porticoccaceae bacterium]|nr:hypothetical protein [Porticoccaceae bacterium]
MKRGVSFAFFYLPDMRCLLFYFFLSLTLSVVIDASEDNEGVRFYRLELFSEARNYFRDQYEMGNRSDELKFNYALSLYQLGEYVDAKSILASMVTEDLNSARVLYALANIELELGNLPGAVDLFTAIYLSGDPDFANYAKVRISELDEVVPDDTFKGFVSLSGGRSDDVAGLNDEILIGTVDNLQELTVILFWERQLANNRTWETELLAFKREYELESSQNFLVYMLRGGSEDALGSGVLRWRVGREESYLGGEGYLATTSVNLNYDMPIVGGYLGIVFERGYNEPLTDQFSYAGGIETTWELSYSSSITKNDDYFLTYSFGELKRTSQDEQDSSNELAMFLGESSKRHAIALDFRYQVTRKIGLSIDVEYSEREYLGGGTSSIYDQAQRVDSQSSAEISAIWQPRRDLDLFIMHSEIKNSSNIAVYEYDYGVSKIGIGWSF